MGVERPAAKKRPGPRRLVLAMGGATLSFGLIACAPVAGRQAPAWREADSAEWQAVRRALERERAALPRDSWAAAVHVGLREPRGRQEVDGRGAIAVAPGRAVRMILVGPAGATMLDAWVTPDRWRIAVPPAGVMRRGTSDEPDDLPVGFLRWSFFRPLEGTLTAGSLRPERLFFLRDGEARVEVRVGRCERGELTTTWRRLRGRAERIDDCRQPGPKGAAGPPRPGDWVRYEDQRSGLRVDLGFESTSGAPDRQAFDDPDTSGREPAP